MKYRGFSRNTVYLHSIRTILDNRNEIPSVIENGIKGGFLQTIFSMTEKSEQFYAGGLIINTLYRARFMRHMPHQEIVLGTAGPGFSNAGQTSLRRI